MEEGKNPLDGMGNVPPPSTVKGKDKNAKKEYTELFKERSLDAQLDSYSQDVKERKKFANWIFILVASWLVAILLVIVLSSIAGCNILDTSDNVIITLIGATTINVIGMFILVAKYLFSDKKPPIMKEKNDGE